MPVIHYSTLIELNTAASNKIATRILNPVIMREAYARLFNSFRLKLAWALKSAIIARAVPISHVSNHRTTATFEAMISKAEGTIAKAGNSPTIT